MNALTIWRPIPGFIGYQVSVDGRVMSYRRRQPVEMRPTLQDGYPRCQLRRNGASAKPFVHDLMLSAFVGPCPAGMEARHLNGIRNDNRLDNLAWGTKRENYEDRLLHGTHFRGERNKFSKLTEVQVREIRSSTMGTREAARHFGVCHKTIAGIRHGKKWGWLQ